MPGPPATLVRSLLDGPVLSGLEWHDEIGSTNAAATAAARRGVPEVYAVLADVQTAGRGRRGRGWVAPSGTSLMLSLVVRPAVPAGAFPLLSLVTAVALAEAVERVAPTAGTALKWPNDLLLGRAGGDRKKAAGILVEGRAGCGSGDAVVVGVGVNVDWRGVTRPPDLAAATSLAEALSPGGEAVDRWCLLDAFVAAFGDRYRCWQADPTAFLAGYRRRCVTLGQRVTVTRVGTEALHGDAVAVDDDGALRVRDDDGRAVRCTAGDVEHVRGARGGYSTVNSTRAV